MLLLGEFISRRRFVSAGGAVRFVVSKAIKIKVAFYLYMYFFFFFSMKDKEMFPFIRKLLQDLLQFV